jgi:hypothetical protein
MNITTNTVRLYQVYDRNEAPALPPIVSERLHSMLNDSDEFTSPHSVHCWLFRRMEYSLATFTTDTSFKRAESHCSLVPGSQFWQYLHEGEFHFAASEHPAQPDLWLLTPATLTDPALRDTPKAQGFPEILIVEQFVFTS